MWNYQIPLSEQIYNFVIFKKSLTITCLHNNNARYIVTYKRYKALLRLMMPFSLFLLSVLFDHKYCIHVYLSVISLCVLLLT